MAITKGQLFMFTVSVLILLRLLYTILFQNMPCRHPVSSISILIVIRRTKSFLIYGLGSPLNKNQSQRLLRILYYIIFFWLYKFKIGMMQKILQFMHTDSQSYISSFAGTFRFYMTMVLIVNLYPSFEVIIRVSGILIKIIICPGLYLYLKQH